MFDIIKDTLIDVLKLLPFLFFAFLLIEFIEHRLDKKVLNTKKIGPFLASFLGVIPQCGFGSFATNLYSVGIISLGSLIAIYLSTSDEMIPILLSSNISVYSIIKIVILKIIVSLIFGYLIDFFFRKKNNKKINDICHDENCGCKESIFKSSIKHTIKIAMYLLIFSFILNILLSYLGEDALSKFVLFNTIFSPFITCLIGLIPNCASSVLLTKLYTSGVIGFPSFFAGLLTGSGVALIILFKTNKNLKQNILIVSLLYFIGVSVGIVLKLIGLTI